MKIKDKECESIGFSYCRYILYGIRMSESPMKGNNDIGRCIKSRVVQ